MLGFWLCDVVCFFLNLIMSFFDEDDFYWLFDVLMICVLLYDVYIRVIVWVNCVVCIVFGFLVEELLLLKVLDMMCFELKYCCEIVVSVWDCVFVDGL